MEEEKKNKIVESLLSIMFIIGSILIVATVLIFTFNTNSLFGLFILGIVLIITPLIYKDEI
jgi:hypothetical protein